MGGSWFGEDVGGWVVEVEEKPRKSGGCRGGKGRGRLHGEVLIVSQSQCLAWEGVQLR